MRKILLLVVAVCAYFMPNAQTVQIGTGTNVPASTLYGPMYRFSATSTTTAARCDMLWTQAELAAAGIPSGAQITAIEFNKTNVANFVTPAGFTVYMGNTSNTALATTQTWAAITSNFTQVFTNASYNIPSAAGWVNIPVTPFTYTGGALEIATNLSMGGNGGATDKFQWEYTNTTLPDKIVGAPSAAATLNGTTAAYKWRPNIKITYTAAGCTTPPTAGTTVSSVTGGICAGTNVTLSLTGNSAGSGQTYQLQTAATATGTYTNVGAPTSGTANTIVPSTTLWYRYEVICGATSATSTPVLVTVNPLFAAGTYTINGSIPASATNFQTFNAAVNATACGIAGPIVFNVAPGTYNEQVIIPEIPTTSASNTITFNGNNATLTYAATATGERATLKLNGADYIKVNNLRIVATGATYGVGVHLTNDADHNLINGCSIYSDTTATGSGFAGITISGPASATATASDCDSNTISNNIIDGGYYGITLMGNGVTSRISGNSITGNTITNFYYYGIYLNGNEGLSIDSNDFSRPTRTTNSAFYCVYLTTGNIGTNVNKNRIHDSNTGQPGNSSTQYCIYLSADGTTAKPNIISNNLIYNINGDGAAYGIYKSGADTAKIWHNTISLDFQHNTPPTTATYGFYQTAVHYGMDFSNNIISLGRNATGNRYCVYIATATATYTGNGNVFYLSGTSGTYGIGYYSGSAAPAITDWRTATSQDATSVDANPFFAGMAAGNFKPSAASCDNIGLPVGILTDVTGATRSTTTPDPGAYEFVAGGCSSPPTPGITTSSVTGGVCSGTDVLISLAGNSVGTGQTYQLQSATTVAGPYTNVGAASGNISTTVTINSSVYYRYAVTCGTSTAYSTPVLVVVNSILAGGTYTINNGAPASPSNFQTFNAAVNAMICGISGPVTFDVASGSGPYNEQVIIPQISGASGTNKIIFNGNGSSLTYTATASAERATVKLDGADYITFNNLNIFATGNTYGIGVQMLNDADNNAINGCNIYTDTTEAGSGFAGISISGSATSATTANSNCDSVSLTNNIINGGYYGITMLGNGTTSRITGNKITGNTISNFYYYGVYLNGTDGLLMESNDLNRATRSGTSTMQAIYVTTGNIGIRISKNRIHNSCGSNPASTSIQYGIYLSADGIAGKPNMISNNAIYDFNGAGTIYGIYKTGADNTTIQHNTISMDYQAATPATSAVYGFYQTAVHTDFDFSDNMITVSRNSTGARYCVYVATATATYTGNYNNLYTSGTSGTTGVGYYAGAARSTLTDWQMATSQDANSQSMDPMYVSLTNGDLKATNMQLDNLGLDVGITTDIVNQTRVLPPDIGAFEFGSACEKVSGLSVSATTGTAATIIWNALTGAQGYEYVLSQSPTVPTTSGTLIAGTSYTATGLAPLTTYYFHIRVKCPTGGFSYWNTVPFTTLCFVAPPNIIPGTDTVICPNQPITLRTDAGTNLTYQWYLNGGLIPLATDEDYSTATPGVYTVTSTMGSCNATSDPITITVDTRLQAVITVAGTSTICEGGSIRLTANTGTGFEYQWLRDGVAIPRATGSIYSAEYSGSYTVRITSSAPCPAISNPIVVTVNTKPYPQITRTGNTISTTTNFTTYQWFRNGQIIPGANTASYNFSRDGNYTVQVTDANNCTGNSSAYPVNFLGIGDVRESDVVVFPNPALHSINIAAPVPVSARIYSFDGKLLLDAPQATHIDISKLSGGVYMIYIRDQKDHILQVEKLVKMQ